MDTSADGDFVPPLLTAEEEDTLVHARILSDERALRKVVRKFYSYAFATEPDAVARGVDDTEICLDEAREALLAEIATFQMTLQKSNMICQAEARQILEYEKEQKRIADEQETTRQHIAELRVTLEEEQKFRSRKQEYDKISEKINTLPTRAELEDAISCIREETTAIQEDNYHKDRMMHARKVALDQIVSSLEALRQMDKETDDNVTPPVEAQATDFAIDEDGQQDGEDQDQEEREESRRDRERDRAARDRDRDEDGENETGGGGGGGSRRADTPLNLGAKPFLPRNPLERLREGEYSAAASRVPSMAPSPRPRAEEEEGEEQEDVEMGEVSESLGLPQNQPPANGGQKGKTNMEELEEGEASDGDGGQAGPAA